MDISIGLLNKETKDVEVIFSQSNFKFTRRVNAVLNSDGTYNAEETQARVHHVSLGLVHKASLGTITNEFGSFDATVVSLEDDSKLTSEDNVFTDANTFPPIIHENSVVEETPLKEGPVDEAYLDTETTEETHLEEKDSHEVVEDTSATNSAAEETVEHVVEETPTTDELVLHEDQIEPAQDDEISPEKEIINPEVEEETPVVSEEITDDKEIPSVEESHEETPSEDHKD